MELRFTSSTTILRDPTRILRCIYSLIKSFDLKAKILSNQQTPHDVEEFLNRVPVPSGSSRISDKLDQLICEYQATLKEYVDSRPARRWRVRSAPKKAIYVVITDGKNTDAEVVGNIIADMAYYLDNISALKTQFGIEFVQIGEGNNFLGWLDRDMYLRHQVRVSIPFTSSGDTLECG